MQFPTDFGTVIAYIALFFIVWYTVVWATRMLLTIIWPLFIICSAIVVFRIISYYEPDEITEIVFTSFSIVADTLVTVLAKVIDLSLSVFD